MYISRIYIIFCIILYFLSYFNYYFYIVYYEKCMKREEKKLKTWWHARESSSKPMSHWIQTCVETWKFEVEIFFFSQPKKVLVLVYDSLIRSLLFNYRAFHKRKMRPDKGSNLASSCIWFWFCRVFKGFPELGEKENVGGSKERNAS